MTNCGYALFPDLDFEPKEVKKTVTVMALPDRVFEPFEQFQLQLLPQSELYKGVTMFSSVSTSVDKIWKLSKAFDNSLKDHSNPVDTKNYENAFEKLPKNFKKMNHH